MRLITIEEHFASPGFLAGPGREFDAGLRRSGERGAGIADRLCRLDATRIAEMDAGGIDMQVLSLNAPGVEQAEIDVQMAISREANDFLFDAIKKHPTRFAGFAALPTGAPEAAAAELQDRISRQGFKGAIINGHTRGRYLDDVFFSPILECAQSLSVPIYLHPTIPPKPVVDALYGGFAPSVSATLAASAWGWHIETAVHLIRMILGGVFDRYPNLQVVIGHLGEGIPFMLPRLTRNLPMEMTKLKRPVEAYLRQNVHYTFGGFNFPATFQNLLSEVGASRIIFSVDYPYQSMSEGRVFLDHLPLTPADRESIAHGNAERLLRLEPLS